MKSDLNRDLSLSETYLILSRFTAALKCGHTFCSYFNQSQPTKDSLFNKSDKVPFTFTLFEKRLFIDKNLSENPALTGGTEVLSINGVAVPYIINSLLPYLKGDGSNDGKRLIDLNLTGTGKFEAFDIFFPLLFPPVNGQFTLELKSGEYDPIRTETVTAIKRSERFAVMEARYEKQPSTLDELWSFKIPDGKTAHLKIGTFVTYKLTMDWKDFLEDAFDEIGEKKIGNLILDIRGNEGGDDQVNLVLGNYLAKTDIKLPEFRELLRYEKVKPEHKPVLRTWDEDFFDRTGELKVAGNGFYTWKKKRSQSTIEKNRNAFKGNVFLLVDAANSSATFFLTAGLQQNKIATVIGSETGGNLKGTNGGQLFFLWLPNSGIEIDIPLIGYFPTSDQPDKGITPDITVPFTLDDLKNDSDPVFQKALDLSRSK